MAHGAQARLFIPKDSPQPTPGYSHVAEVLGGRLVYLAGQLSLDAAGQLVNTGDFRAQVELAFHNLDIAVRATGGTCHDLIKLTYYCSEKVFRPELNALRETRDRYVDTAHPPVSTLVFVPRFIHPDYLFEVDGVAVVAPH